LFSAVRLGAWASRRDEFSITAVREPRKRRAIRAAEGNALRADFFCSSRSVSGTVATAKAKANGPAEAGRYRCILDLPCS
jgi:hypothetical protein